MDEHTVRRMKKQLRGVVGRVSECVGALQSPSNGRPGDEQAGFRRFVEATDGLMSQVLELEEAVAMANGDLVPNPEIERVVIELVLVHLADALANTCARVSTIDKDVFLTQAGEMFDVVVGLGGEGIEGSEGVFYGFIYSRERTKSGP